MATQKRTSKTSRSNSAKAETNDTRLSFQDRIAERQKEFKANMEKTAEFSRKGFRAYIGLYGLAYDNMLKRFERLSADFDSCAEKGENIQEEFKQRMDESVENLRSKLPDSANEKISELEAQIAKLNKKIAEATTGQTQTSA